MRSRPRRPRRPARRGRAPARAGLGAAGQHRRVRPLPRDPGRQRRTGSGAGGARQQRADGERRLACAAARRCSSSSSSPRPSCSTPRPASTPTCSCRPPTSWRASRCRSALARGAQRRPLVVEPLYERRPDVEIVFGLATRLGLGDQFGDGDPVRAYDEVLAPAGLSWAALADEPEGLSIAPLPSLREVRRRRARDGGPVGFATPSGKVELFSDTFAAHGHAPLPSYAEPAESPRSTPDLAAEYPLVLTNAKRPQYLHSQHRAVAAIRKTAPAPTAELHPETAAAVRHPARRLGR